MKLYLKYNINEICRKILDEQLKKLELNYSIIALAEVDVNETLTNERLEQLHSTLNNYGIEIVETQKSILVQKIKDVIVEMVSLEEELPISKNSAYIANKLNHSYGYLSNLFSDITFTSIENFIILQKIERAKQLITSDEFNFTDIAWKLNYSSVAHFSTQFKNTTGLTPTAFKRIINKRRNISN